MCAAFSEISKTLLLAQPRAELQERRHLRVLKLRNEPMGLRQQVSGAVPLPVAVSGGPRVNGTLGLKSRLVLAGGPAAALAAVLDAVEEIDGETCRRGKRGLEKERRELR